MKTHFGQSSVSIQHRDTVNFNQQHENRIMIMICCQTNVSCGIYCSTLLTGGYYQLQSIWVPN